ncbi:MAG: CRISPR-associated endonuclease Cas2 [Candidatus Dojkabacteria bacterium]|nr:CRISPR-associated endonuclease Cas2 [Candidatus Dojkabacteria bacterium]
MSNIRFMRILVLFDLPVVKKEDREKATKFRNFLINDGYEMLQFSVYSRIVNSVDATKKHLLRLERAAPKLGSVRVLIVTEKQYSDMIILRGKNTVREKKLNTDQLVLF